MPAQALTLSDLGKEFDELAGALPSAISIGVTDPEVSRYVRAVEFGSLLGERPWPHPGPRTTLAVDPESGAQVVVSAEAPHGFIRVQASSFLEELRRGMSGRTNWLNVSEVNDRISASVRQAGEAALERLRAALPDQFTRLKQSLAVLTEEDGIQR
jgi:hypothetical protein